MQGLALQFVRGAFSGASITVRHQMSTQRIGSGRQCDGQVCIAAHRLTCAHPKCTIFTCHHPAAPASPGVTPMCVSPGVTQCHPVQPTVTQCHPMPPGVTQCHLVSPGNIHHASLTCDGVVFMLVAVRSQMGTGASPISIAMKLRLSSSKNQSSERTRPMVRVPSSSSSCETHAGKSSG